MGIDDNMIGLAAAIILSAVCTVVGHLRLWPSQNLFAPILILTAFGIGTVLVADPYHHVFLLGVIGYGLYGLARHRNPSRVTAFSLGQLALAALFCIMRLFTVESVQVLAQVMLAVTFLPFAPFHVPFVTVLRASPAPLVGHWVVVWLAVGLSQVRSFQDWLPFEEIGYLQLILLGSGAYASLKALGLRSLGQSLAYVTIALLALLWGLLPLFSPLVNWVLPSGMGIGFLIGALLLAYSFLCRRYGTHEWKGLQGLGAGMPRFRALVTLVVSLAMFLPVLPIALGISGMSLRNPNGGSLGFLIPTFFVVWMSSSWHLSRVLDQMAFGKPRVDIAHEDLHVNEMVPLVLLSAATGLCGIFL